MNKKTEFKKSYAEGGLEYHKRRDFSPVNLAYNFFPAFLMEIIKEKVEKHNKFVQDDIWKNLSKCKKVLDIGCGGGRFLKHAPPGIEAEGIEIIDSEIEKCNKKGLKVKKCDITKELIFKKESFDGATMFHVIEHLSDPVSVLEKTKKILKKDGIFLIITPNFAVNYRHFYDDPTHKKPFTKQSLFRVLYNCGFEDIKIKNDILHANNSIISLFVLFPYIKFRLEKLLGRIYSPYITATCRKP
jgi:SAM-dependent methyltransferase